MSIDARPSSRGFVIFVLFLTAIGLPGCSSRSTQQTDTRADVAALRDLHDQVTRAQNSGDATIVERTDASDVVILPPNGSLIAGREAHMRLYQESFNKFTMISDNKSDEIVVSGDWGFDRGTYRYSETPRAGGATVVTEGNYLWLARREQDGMWRYARIIWNTREPVPRNEER